jgi:hypothetical protein
LVHVSERNVEMLRDAARASVAPGPALNGRCAPLRSNDR